jgi:hypothetical protein
VSHAGRGDQEVEVADHQSEGDINLHGPSAHPITLAVFAQQKSETTVGAVTGRSAYSMIDVRAVEQLPRPSRVRSPFVPAGSLGLTQSLPAAATSTHWHSPCRLGFGRVQKSRARSWPSRMARRVALRESTPMQCPSRQTELRSEPAGESRSTGEPGPKRLVKPTERVAATPEEALRAHAAPRPCPPWAWSAM